MAERPPKKPAAEVPPRQSEERPKWVAELGMRDGAFDPAAFYADALENPLTKLMVEEETLRYLNESEEMKHTRQFFNRVYSGRMTSSGSLIDTDGRPTQYTPSRLIADGDPRHIQAIAETVRAQLDAKYGSESAMNPLSSESGVNPEYAANATAAAASSRERMRALVRGERASAASGESAPEPAAEPQAETVSVEVPKVAATESAEGARAPLIAIDPSMTGEQMRALIEAYRKAMVFRAISADLSQESSKEFRKFADLIMAAEDDATKLDAEPAKTRPRAYERLAGKIVLVNGVLAEELEEAIRRNLKGRDAAFPVPAQPEPGAESPRIEQVVIGGGTLASAAPSDAARPVQEAPVLPESEQFAPTPRYPLDMYSATNGINLKDAPKALTGRERMKQTRERLKSVGEMQEAEKAYLKELKKEYRAFHKNGGTTIFEHSNELKELKRKFNGSRLAYRNELLADARTRIAERPMSEERRELLLKRYDRLVAYETMVAAPRRRENQALLEAQGSRAMALFKKTLGGLASVNRGIERIAGGPLRAKVLKAAVVTAVLAAAGPAAAGVGLISWQIGRRTAAAVLGASAAVAGNRIAGNYADRRYAEQTAAAEQSISAAKIEARSTRGDIDNLDSLTEADETADVVAAAQQELKAINDIKSLIRFGGAAIAGVAVGGGFGMGLSSLDGFFSGSTDAVDQATQTASSRTPADSGNSSVRTAPVADATKPNAAASTQAPENPTTAPAPETAPARPTVSETAPKAPEPAVAPKLETLRVTAASGSGTDSMIGDLKDMLAKQPGAADSPVVKLLLEKDANAISRMMDDYGTRGMNLKPGDSFYLDAKQNLMFKPAGGEAQPFLTNDPTHPGGIKVHDLSGRELAPAPEPVRAAPAEAPAAKPSADSVDEAEKTRLLNEQQIKNSAPAQPAEAGELPAGSASEAAAPSEPAEAPSESAPPNLTEYGADLAKKDVYGDGSSNVFAHVPADPGKTIEEMNDARALFAQEEAWKNIGQRTWFVMDVQKPGFLWFDGTTEQKVLGYVRLPGSNDLSIITEGFPPVPDPSSFRPLS